MSGPFLKSNKAGAYQGLGARPKQKAHELPVLSGAYNNSNEIDGTVRTWQWSGRVNLNSDIALPGQSRSSPVNYVLGQDLQPWFVGCSVPHQDKQTEQGNYLQFLAVSEFLISRHHLPKIESQPDDGDSGVDQEGRQHNIVPSPLG